MARRREGERGRESFDDTKINWEMRGAGVKSSAGLGKLASNLAFRKVVMDTASLQPEGLKSGRRIALNLMAYDGRGHLFVWNSQEKLLHVVDIQHSDSLQSFTDSSSLLAKTEFKTVQTSSEVEFSVRYLVFNRTGRSLAMAGNSGLMVVDLVPHLSASSDTPASVPTCRTSKIGGNRLFPGKNEHSLCILQVAWHPYSDTHLGVLSSDGVFRLFDLSLDDNDAEQEYHLQVDLPARPALLPLARAVGFAFGGEHLWDRFTVFFLFSNSSIYALCPMVPFGSMFNGAAIDELVKDAMHFTLLSSTRDTKVAGNASLALAWLEAVFRGFGAWSDNAAKELASASFMLKAHAHVPLDASLLLQGPLSIVGSIAKQADSISYTVVGKDSILIVTGRDGFVHLYGVDDEMQPMWSTTSPPRLNLNENGLLLSVGMLALASRQEQTRGSQGKGGGDSGASCPWAGQPPPLVGLADLELSLHPPVLDAAPVSLFVDPVVPKRLYCYHAAGMDAIILQWLPFSDKSANRRFGGDPVPLLVPLLDTYPAGDVVPLPLLGVAAILDPLGETWLVAVTSRGECSVVKMKPQTSPLYVEGSRLPEDSEPLDAGVFQTMSRELLLGPKDIPIAQVTSSGSPLTVDTVEGRAFLHDQCKLLHEKYIEYAHRVYVELTSHGGRLQENVEEQQQLLQQVQEKLRHAQKGTALFAGRVQQALQTTWQLEQRIKRCSSLPGLRHKSLSEAEQNFKLELDTIRLQNHEIFRSVIDELAYRSERVLPQSQAYSKKASPSPSLSGSSGGKQSRPVISGSQSSHLKVAVDQLLHQVEDLTTSLNVLDVSVSQHEHLLDH